MKNTIYVKLLIFAVILFTLLIVIFSFTYISSLEYFYKNLIIICSTTLVIVNFITILYFSMIIRRKKQIVLNKFDHYIEKEISKTGSGALLLEPNSLEIIWASNFLEQKFNKTLIGRKITSISPEFKKNYELNKKNFVFKINEVFFEAKINYLDKIIILKDITIKKILEDQYKKEKLVIGELEIDNFRQIQSALTEEEIFKVQTIVIQMLDDLVLKYNVLYRQYVQGKFLVFTDNETLEKWKDEKFIFLDKSKNFKTSDNLSVTLSIGFGVGSNVSLKKLVELAKEGLIQSASRGGNQVTINIENRKPQYFGSKTEIDASTSRVQINQVAKLFESKLESSKIENVIIYSHKIADLDAVGAALGINYISKKFQKNSYIQIQTFDNTTEKVLNETFSKEEINETFISRSKANKISNKNNTLVIIVDTWDFKKTENLDAYKNVNMENVFVFDHHRVTEIDENLNKNNVYIDSKASSASEIITEILRFTKKTHKIDKKISQFLLNGIYLDTNHFIKATTSKTFSAASWLERHGAVSSVSSNILKIPKKKAIIISKIMSEAKEVKPGFFLSVYNEEVPEDIISIVANEMLRIEGRKATFVIAKLPGKKLYKMSARGINTNVQIIAESIGGGGHFSSSAAVSNEPIKVFADNLIQSIVSEKDGK